MPDPVAYTALGIPGWVWLWLATLAAFGLFGRRVLGYVRILRSARPERRWDRPGRRIKLVLAHVLGHRRLVEEPVIGAAHLLIFWSFVFYAASFFWSLLRGLFPFLPIPYADEPRWMALILAVFGLLGLAALAVAAARRYLVPPPRLEKSVDAGIILALIAVVLVSSLAGLWFRARQPALALAMWWTHMITVLGFLAYLPYSKHLHLLASPFAVFFASLRPGALTPSTEGAARREEFTWRQLLSGLACAECGRCDRACPAFQSGSALSPKILMHHMKELVRGTAAGNGDTFVGGTVRQEEIWACTTCLACIERCPVMNEHVPVLVEMRRHLIGKGDMDRSLQEALMNLDRYGNAFGQPPRARAKWTEKLDFAIPDARKQPVRYLWFLGDYASYDPRVTPSTCAAARIFREAGLEFGILYGAEQNAGNDVRLAGEEGLFETLRERNLKTFERARFETLVTTDPHSYHALKTEYPTSNGDYALLHHTQLINELICSGKLEIRQRLRMTATYHDGCYLGRYNAIFEAPRRVLQAIGVKLVEMPESRSYSYCCGAGGGRIWMAEPPVFQQERPAERRVRQAARLKGVHTLVVSCPKDLVMFQDAIKTTGLDGKLTVKELSELVEQAMG